MPPSPRPVKLNHKKIEFMYFPLHYPAVGSDTEFRRLLTYNE